MPIEVLLVEDSPGDVRLTREALREYVAKEFAAWGLHPVFWS